MRTRIKVIEKNNGEKRYQPQVKDDITTLDVILFLPVLFIFGKSIWRYVGLNTYEHGDMFLLYPLNVHPGVSSDRKTIFYIEQCHITDGLQFDTLEEAKIYLEKYLQRVKEDRQKKEKKVDEMMAGMTKKEYYIEKTKIEI